MFSKLKDKKGKQALEKKLHHFKRNVVFHNLDNTKTLSVLYKYESKHSADFISKLFQEFSSYGIKCEAIGFFNEKNLPLEYAPRASHVVICQADLAWSGIPKSEEVEKFINVEYDILLDLSRSDALIFKYIASLSKAQFKIGSVEYRNNPYDFIFIEDTNSDQSFVDQVFRFLRSIKTA
ncbi:MAG: hypothetical protein LBG19_09400 [Prevotellaceae bacterium]|jgi:hypothetical protein|nr:hypothetical protein [Prevotellaceae bacterium]